MTDANSKLGDNLCATTRKNLSDYSVMVVDDNIAILSQMRLTLSGRFQRVVTVRYPKMMEDIFADPSKRVDVVILDMNFSPTRLDGSEGEAYLKAIRKNDGYNPVVLLMTAFPDINLAVKTMRLGADNFICKPFTNEEMIAAIESAIIYHESHNVEPEIAGAKPVREKVNLDDLEREYIIDTINVAGSLTDACEILGISRQSLYNRLKKYDIKVDLV